MATTDWYKADRNPFECSDFDRHPAYRAAREQISQLTPRPQRLVEIGSGSGNFLAHLKRVLGLNVLGSDILSPRLEAAIADHPDIEFLAADGASMMRRHSDRGTAFLAMHVLGNLRHEEVEDMFNFLRVPGTTLTFSVVEYIGHAKLPAGVPEPIEERDYLTTARRCGLTILEQDLSTLQVACRKRLVATLTRLVTRSPSMQKILKPHG